MSSEIIVTAKDEERTGKAVYTTLSNPYDNDKDFLFLEDAHLIHLKPLNIKDASITTSIEKNNTKLDLSFKYDENDAGKMQLIVGVEDKEYASQSIDLQTFVDEICDARYKDIPYSEQPNIKEAINNILTPFTNNYFIKEGKLFLDTNYDFYGFAYNSNNEKVAFINKFSVLSYISGSISICLKEVISYLPFDDLDIASIKLMSNNKKFVINKFQIEDKKEGFIKEYNISVFSYEIEDNKVPLLNFNIEYSDENLEDFFDERAVNLVKAENLLVDDNSFEEIFDDFDF